MFTKTWTKKQFKEKDPLSFTAVSDERGRIVIPASVRKKLGLKFGSRVKTIVRGDYKY